jgi:hypothetical protein
MLVVKPGTNSDSSGFYEGGGEQEACLFPASKHPKPNPRNTISTTAGAGTLVRNALGFSTKGLLNPPC